MVGRSLRLINEYLNDSPQLNMEDSKKHIEPQIKDKTSNYKNLQKLRRKKKPANKRLGRKKNSQMEDLEFQQDDLNKVVLGKRTGNLYQLSPSSSSSMNLLFHERANTKNLKFDEPHFELDSSPVPKRLFALRNGQAEQQSQDTKKLSKKPPQVQNNVQNKKYPLRSPKNKGQDDRDKENMSPIVSESQLKMARRKYPFLKDVSEIAKYMTDYKWKEENIGNQKTKQDKVSKKLKFGDHHPGVRSNTDSDDIDLQPYELFNLKTRAYPKKLQKFVQDTLPSKFEQIFTELRRRKYLSKGFVEQSFSSLEQEIAQFIAQHMPE